MKRLVVLIALVSLLTVPVLATQITFDHSTDFADHCNCSWSDATPSGTECRQVFPGGAANGYMTFNPASGRYAFVTAGTQYQTTYAAATALSRTNGGFNAAPFKSAWADEWGILDGNISTGRYEVIVSGTTATYYYNGQVLDTLAGVTTTPYFIGFGVESGLTPGNLNWDDYVYGSSEDTHILSIPVDYYELQNDIIADSKGLVFSNNRSIISGVAMSTRYGRSGVYDNENETVVLRNALTQTAYQTQYLPEGNFAGTLTWNLTDFFESEAPYGWYEIAIPSSGSDSEDIYYGAIGATVTFDAASYTTSSTAGITYTVTDSGTPPYWTPGSYDYRVDVISATTGETYCSSDIATSTGSVTCPFESGDTVGTVWAILIAKDKITNEDLWMGYDYADLNTYVSFTGYVNSETGAPISGARVNITQGSITGAATTIADGNYSLTGYISGSALSFNVTASGYNQYYVNLTPLSPQEINLNFTLVSLSRAAVGSTIGGVARDGVYSAGTITSGYGRPIPSATVYIKNTTNSESYTRTTNVAGYYVCGESESCFLTPSRPYDLWGQRAGYANSANYTVVAG